MYGLLNQLDSQGNFVQPNTPEAKANYLRQAKMRNTNWFNTLFRANVMQNHAVSASSGNEKSAYYASLSALIAPGWTLASKMNRYTGNLNASFKLSPQFQLNLLTNASYRLQKTPGTISQSTDPVNGEVKRDFDINPYSYAINTSRTLSPDEFYVRDFAPFNIIHELNNNYMDLSVTDLRFQGDIKWKITPKIDATMLGALKTQNTNIEHHSTEFSNQAESYRAMQTADIRMLNPRLYRDPDKPYELPIIAKFL